MIVQEVKSNYKLNRTLGHLLAIPSNVRQEDSEAKISLNNLAKISSQKEKKGAGEMDP